MLQSQRISAVPKDDESVEETSAKVPVPAEVLVRGSTRRWGLSCSTPGVQVEYRIDRHQG